MKFKIIILFILLITSAPAMAGEPWSNGEVALEATFLTLQYIDYKQTSAIASNDNYYENNIILGKNPSKGQVNLYFLATSLGHIAITDMLPPKYRKIWQMITIGVEAGCVSHNYSAGVRIRIF